MKDWLNKLRRKSDASKPAPQPLPESTQTSQEPPQQSSYASDLPIQSQTEDRFNRWPFAQRIADTIARRSDSTPLVIGVYGAWGDGKTSTLRMMEQALREYHNVVHTRFNPWHFTSESELLRGFFANLAQTLGSSISSRKEELGKLLEKYSWILSLASASVAGGSIELNPGEAVRELGRGLSTVDLDELKSRIEEILRSTGKRVVVLIDDIDRLNKKEIQAIFKLVKLSASFEYTSYVLAFDEEIIAASLGEAYGEGDADAGKKFLEKIVQVPLHLPPADELSLRKLAFDGVNEALELAQIDLAEESAQAFVRHFIDGLEPRLKTPRRAKLYSNVLAFALPILKGEVNPVDQMLIEGVRLFYPKLYGTIRENPDVFIGSGREASRDEAFKRRVASLVNEGLEELDGAEKERVRRQLLERLFPRLQSIFGNTFFDYDWENTWEREQRICSREYFSRYFSYGVPPGDVSDQSIRMLIDTIVKADDTETTRVFKALAERNALPKVIHKFSRRRRVLDEATSLSLVRAISRNAALLPREKTAMGVDSTFSQAAILISSLLTQAEDPTKRENAAHDLINSSDSLQFALQCFRWMGSSSNTPEKDQVISKSAEASIGNMLAVRIESQSAKGPLWQEFPQDTPHLLWIWKTHGDFEATVAHLEKHLANNPSEICAFLATYVPTAWSLESGLPRKSEFRREAYDTVKGFIDPDNLVSTLRTRYGSIIDNGEYFQSSETPFEQRVAVQFAYVHRKAKAESDNATAEQTNSSTKVEST